MHAKEAHSELLRQVALLLKPHGYARKGHRFVRDNEFGTYVVQIQSSQSSTAEKVRFTINYALYLKVLDPLYREGKIPASLETTSGDIEGRIGRLILGQGDIWWVLEAENASAINEACGAIEEFLLPFLDKFTSNEYVFEYWKSLAMGDPVNFPIALRTSALAKVLGHLEELDQLRVRILSACSDNQRYREQAIFHFSWLNKFPRS